MENILQKPKGEEWVLRSKLASAPFAKPGRDITSQQNRLCQPGSSHQPDQLYALPPRSDDCVRLSPKIFLVGLHVFDGQQAAEEASPLHSFVSTSQEKV